MDEITTDIYKSFDYILDRYYEIKYGDSKSWDEIDQMIENFKKELTNKKLIEAYNKHQFSKEEIEYIDLVQITSKYRDRYVFGCGNAIAKYAIIDILLRSKIIEYFGEESIEIFKNLIQHDFLERGNCIETSKYYIELLSDKPYGENIHQQYQRRMEECVEHDFNYKINCGGYAFKIDACIFPSEDVI